MGAGNTKEFNWNYVDFFFEPYKYIYSETYST